MGRRRNPLIYVLYGYQNEKCKQELHVCETLPQAREVRRWMLEESGGKGHIEIAELRKVGSGQYRETGQIW